MSAPAEGVSFVIPVHNAERWLRDVLSAVLEQDDGRPLEVIVVDDSSEDGSAEIIRQFAADSRVRVVRGEGRGAAAAINLGVANAKNPIICQVDHDVIVLPGWMTRLVSELDSPTVAAVQAYYATDPGSSAWARVMGRDLEERYARIEGAETDHVCTGNTAYRAEALRKVGGFDETMGYGYDNDMSYRLSDAGYRLRICREARSIHRWREDIGGYLKQQYGFGYGRLDLVAKHARYAGDRVSSLSMMMHAPLLVIALLALGLAGGMALLSSDARIPLGIAATILGWLVLERVIAGVRVWRRFGDPVGLWFAPVHLLRDAAWVTAIVVWCLRRLGGQSSRPSQSMRRERP